MSLQIKHTCSSIFIRFKIQTKSESSSLKNVCVSHPNWNHVSCVFCLLIFLHVSVSFPSCLLPCSLSLSGPTASHRALLPPRPHPRVPCPIPICQQVHTHKHFINCIIFFGYNCFNTVPVCVYSFTFLYLFSCFCFSVLVLFMMTHCQWLTGTFE